MDQKFEPNLSYETWWTLNFKDKKSVNLKTFTDVFVASFNTINLSKVHEILQIIPTLFMGWAKDHIIEYEKFKTFVNSLGKNSDVTNAVTNCCKLFFNNGTLAHWWVGKRESVKKDAMFQDQKFLMRFADEEVGPINDKAWWLTLRYINHKGNRKRYCSIWQGVITLYSRDDAGYYFERTIDLDSFKEFILEKTDNVSLCERYDTYVVNMINVARGRCSDFIKSDPSDNSIKPGEFRYDGEYIAIDNAYSCPYQLNT